MTAGRPPSPLTTTSKAPAGSRPRRLATASWSPWPALGRSSSASGRLLTSKIQVSWPHGRRIHSVALPCPPHPKPRPTWSARLSPWPLRLRPPRLLVVGPNWRQATCQGHRPDRREAGSQGHLTWAGQPRPRSRGHWPVERCRGSDPERPAGNPHAPDVGWRCSSSADFVARPAFGSLDPTGSAERRRLTPDDVG
jgi:hypothetical protein